MRTYEIGLVALSNLKSLLSSNNVHLVFLKLYNVGICRSPVDSLEKLLQGNSLTLGFAFDL
jgi:hypothetical protein